ncbi:MAG: hypothetical protein KJO66_00185 [Gammaproteobacteria bacterium]|nr:hypothetical protein [Gammaproteobacteria bacterium]NNJ94796.1 SPOR domain-containing protein [Halobacteria archaeon]
MRHIVYLLLVANLLFFAWNHFQAQTTVDSEQSLPPLPAGVNALVTLQEHERDMSGPADGQDIEALTRAQPPGALSAGRCKALGPFREEVDVKAVADRLGDSGLDPVLRAVENRVENGYWVYLSGKDKEHAREMVKQLEEHDDNEYYVGMGYFISLGTFVDIERANIRLEDVREKGFDAILEQRYKTRVEYWLELPENTASFDLLDSLVGENPDLEIHAVSCQ